MDWFLRERCLHPERFKQYKSRILGVGKQYILGLKVYDSNASALRKDIANLSSNQSRLGLEIDQLRADFLWYMENANQIANLYLKPNVIAKLLGVSTKTIAKYRYEGVFRKESIRAVKRNQRTDYFYHRINAIEDLKKVMPVHIKK